MYSGLNNVEIKNYNEKGFFKEYTSTSKNKQIGLEFANNAGMLMYISPDMQRKFICCDVSWISDSTNEEEIYLLEVQI